MPHLDRFSFLIGFAAGIVFAWLIALVQRFWPRIRVFLHERFQALRESMTAGTEVRLRTDMLRLAQRQHLGASFAPLDDVLIQPGLLIPPTPSEQAPNEALLEEQTNLTIPYLPDWPELAATFHVPTITLVEALGGGANLILMGQPGIGKTVALAHLTSLVARQDPLAGELSHLIPVFVHAGDLELPSTLNNPLTDITDAVAGHVSSLTLPRLPGFLRRAFNTGRVLLILDGLDEFGPITVDQATVLLKALLEKYPGNRVIVATTTGYYDGLTALGFIPVALATWTENQRIEFLDKWRQLWEQLLVAENQGPATVDHLVLDGWLSTREVPPTPLEFFLKTWAAYAGDVLGSEIPNSIEAYLRRTTFGIPNARPALEKIAQQMVATQNPSITQREAEAYTAEFELSDISAPPAEETTQKTTAKSVFRVLHALVSNGVLVSRPGSRVSFLHPVFLGYLAAQALTKSGTVGEVYSQPEWTGKSLTLQYLARSINLTELVTTLLSQWDDPLRRGPLTVARWLRVAPKNAPWRTNAMRQLAATLQKDSPTLSLSARILTALASTGDPGLQALFRQLLQSSQENIRLLGALGCGMVNDTKSVPDLSSLTNDPSFQVIQAALFSLRAIGTTASLEAIVSTLLQGSEGARRTAAEILATHPEEGHPVLKEGSTNENLHVRHAIVFGLARLRQPWATQILEKMAVEDGQWIVKNAAAQALEEAKKPHTHIPRSLPPLNNTPWLLSYAAKFGEGIATAKRARELVMQALKEGDDNFRLAAMNFVRLKGTEDNVLPVYHMLYGGQGLLRETAFDTVWHMAAAGINLPSPAQFGLGSA